MKNALLTILVLMSSVGFADGVKLERHAQVIRVNSVSTELIGEGFPSTSVKVTATFSNSCTAPKSDELVAIVQYTKNYENLEIALGMESDRVCPAVFKPVMVTLDLGEYTKPNDGLFEKISVNGKVAK